ncbi:aminoglycoside adenylyltransferase domain-containing protein [Micromonospora sp. WMMD558]|uniref:aminoglycoside adenylyltransferase domain-containing protein n=1 Tax=Micromonospora sp. WMMD558 TaxID=3403462 RepID=UPI003BF597F9
MPTRPAAAPARLPVEVSGAVSRYLDAIDAALPGFVTGLYVTGSAALGAWQAGASDIDTLIVTARPASGGDLAHLARLHAALPDRPCLDGIYLDEGSLAGFPADRRVTPFVVNGQFHADRPCGDLNPVLWLVLCRHGVAVRGPAVADLAIPADSAALVTYLRDNLRTYWRPLARDIREHLRDIADDDPVEADGVAWAVLGPARLHYTLTHGDIVSKAEAGAYLTALLPEWADLADRAVRWRAGEPLRFTAADLRAAAASIDAVVTDADRRLAQAES